MNSANQCRLRGMVSYFTRIFWSFSGVQLSGSDAVIYCSFHLYAADRCFAIRDPGTSAPSPSKEIEQGLPHCWTGIFSKAGARSKHLAGQDRLEMKSGTSNYA